MASPCSARTQPAAAMRAPTRRPSGCRRRKLWEHRSAVHPVRGVGCTAPVCARPEPGLQGQTCVTLSTLVAVFGGSRTVG
eukprot:4139662-Prymnesium_polylepis.1